MNELLPKLLAEDRLIQKFAKPKGNALNSESTPKKENSKNKYRGKRNDHKEKGKKNHSTKSFNGKDFEEYKKKGLCMQCDQHGHIKRDCPKLKPKEEHTKKEEPSDSNVATSIVAETNLTVSSEEWILDSGATEHMTYDRASFNTFRTLSPQKIVRFGNNQFGYGTGTGDIIVISKIGERKSRLILKDVLYVPQLRKLISVAAATANGCKRLIEKDKIIIRDQKGNAKMIAKKDGNLYVVQLSQIESKALTANKEPELKQPFSTEI